MRIVCLSDSHNHTGDFPTPNGDVLIHAGDFCGQGSEREVEKFAKWMDRMPHRHKIVIAGNHDWLFERHPALARAYLEPDVIYLQDTGCEIEGIKFWGSPWQPWFMDWAFNLPRKGPKLREKWNLIPLDTDVLITHGPPYGILDQVRSGPHLGCEELAIRIAAVRPKVHVFGHIHDGHGVHENGGTLNVNASICDEDYRPRHRPIVVDLVRQNGQVMVIPNFELLRSVKTQHGGGSNLPP